MTTSANPPSLPDDGPRRAKTVLVTGAARRLGRAIALRFAKEGWNVALHFHQSREEAERTADEIARTSSAGMLVRGNLEDEQETRAVVANVIDYFGTLDAVVNNAGRFVYDDAGTFSGQNLAHHLGPNLIAPIILAQELAAHVRGQVRDAPGVVVNLLDQKLWNYNPDFFSYTLTKAAMQAATTMLAQALAPAVRVVGVAPGLTLPSYLQSDRDFARTHAMAPLGQSSTPEDIAQAVLFAAQSRSMTGTTIIVDGGQHLVGFKRDFSLS
jgi:NAD(P)-dependent dehydrogenase (short-subunit alcohol dehydrogenase family)